MVDFTGKNYWMPKFTCTTDESGNFRPKSVSPALLGLREYCRIIVVTSFTDIFIRLIDTQLFK